MKKVVFLLLCLLIIGAGYIFFSGSSFESSIKPPPSLQPETTTTTVKSVLGTPTRLQIPSLNVDTAIEQVGMDTVGNMDVPKDPDNAAWYRLGHAVGSNGSAVIAAHFDKPDGSPAVFYNISQLKAGDTIIVSDSSSQSRIYKVTSTTAYPYDNFPMQKVFNTVGSPQLNLITCDGTWDKEKKTYSKRLVVYSELSD